MSLSDRWEAGFGIKVSELSDEKSQTQASLRELKPRGSYILFSKGRLDGSISWIHASSNKTLIPFELARGANRGENMAWSLRGTYQFGQNFSGSLNYDGRRDSGEKTFHTGRVEARATF